MDSLLHLIQRQLDAATSLVEASMGLRTDIQNAEWLGEALVTEGLYLDMERLWWFDAAKLDPEVEKTPEYVRATESLFRYQRDSLGQRLRRVEDLPVGGEWPLAPERKAMGQLHDTQWQLQRKRIDQMLLNASVMMGKNFPEPDWVRDSVSTLDVIMRLAMRSELSGSGSVVTADLLAKIEQARQRIADSDPADP